MTELGLRIPPRNVLTGAAVNWAEDDTIAERVEGLNLAWKYLTVFRKKKILHGVWRSPTYEEVKILHGVSGIATQGNLIAVMGASGAGKTTLLAAISRRDKSDMSGSLMLNGRHASASLVAKISGFVPQQDLAVEELTVGEHMEFMARLMMDRRSSSRGRAARVNLLLTDLNVASCVSTKLQSLSGGEKKRVALAVQLLNDPPILFCDEPTTGLDSWAASEVTSRLRLLAESGKIVICSIHQPASGVFEMYHQVIFLAGGRIAFQGTIQQATDFFSGLQYKCPVGFNKAEYYVSRLSVESGRELESHERIRRICDEFRRSKVAAEIYKKLESVGVDPNSVKGSRIDTGGTESDLLEQYLLLKKVTFPVQFYWLLWRNIVSLRRNYTIWVVEFFLYLGVALLLAVPYMGATSGLDQRGVQNVQGLMYLIVTETIFMFIYSVFITFPDEMPALLRETANGLYAPAPYYLSKVIFWIPRAVVSPTLFASLIFGVVGLQGGLQGWAGLTFVCILCANYANAYGSFLSATFETLPSASLVSIPFDLVGITYSGVFGNLDSLNPLFTWIKYISPFYYGTEAISILQWVNIKDIKCVNVAGMPCIRTGTEVLATFGYAEGNFWRNVLALYCMYVIAHCIAYVMVCRRSRRSPVY